MPARRPIALLLAAALLTGGCGSDGGSTETGDRPLSKRAYIQRADELQRGAEGVFQTLDGRLPATPEQAAPRLATLDELMAGYRQLRPPEDWEDEHERLLDALARMRQSLDVVSRVSASRRAVIETQVGIYEQAQDDFEQAVRDINASR